MDKRIQIWNILHDGGITAISEEGGETLTMFISIPYLRRRLAPLGDSFVVTLLGVTVIEFHNFDATQISLGKVVEIGAPEILSTESKSMPVTIETTMGQLTLDFENIGFGLDTGQAIDFEAIEKISQEYWTEWQAKAEVVAAERRGEPYARAIALERK